ncbi:MAG: glutamine synthetase [SAR202 cluster bacterium]|nr:glutamine synthetase [SAR202 cluster bacterium]
MPKARGANGKSIVDLVREWRTQGIEYVQFELPDMHGTSRSKIIPLNHVESYAKSGLNMYGGTVVLDTASSVVPMTLYNEEVNYADQYLKPDLDTAIVVPWATNTARLICDGQWENGKPLMAAPRQVLKSLLKATEAMGYTTTVGLEYEFYVLEPETAEPTFGGLHIFNTIRNTYVPVIEEVLELMPKAGVDIITANAEYAPSQFEINFAPASGLAAADQAFTFKNGVKAIAHSHGYNATFMTKPFADQAASGCHIHISLQDKKTGKNAFLDKKDKDGLSKDARCFIQGILDHTPASMALLAPTINCYHRFVPHHFAPSNVSWGVQDRTAAIRAKNSGDENTHLENRLGTGLANPYLAVAGTLAGGLLGLKKGIAAKTPAGKGPAEEQSEFKPLPTTLDAALEALLADKEYRALLGEEFVNAYNVMRRYEIARFRSYITDWEKAEYLEIY